jgi:hypothetical protein
VLLTTSGLHCALPPFVPDPDPVPDLSEAREDAAAVGLRRALGLRDTMREFAPWWVAARGIVEANALTAALEGAADALDEAWPSSTRRNPQHMAALEEALDAVVVLLAQLDAQPRWHRPEPRAVWEAAAGWERALRVYHQERQREGALPGDRRYDLLFASDAYLEALRGLTSPGGKARAEIWLGD